MKKERIKEILKKINSAKVAVYGDFCLDAYWLMDPDGSEVSVETGLKAEAVSKHFYSPGGAGNIVANLAELNPAGIKVIGVTGNDIHGRELSSQLKSLGADISSLTVQNENFDTYTYTKKYYGDKEDPRVDFGLKNKRSEKSDAEILKNLEIALKNYDVLIFNQQVEGSIPNRDFIDKANKLFEKYNNKIVLLDSRHFNANFKNVYLKTNEIEIARLNGRDADPHDFIPIEDIRKYGSKVYKKYEKSVFVTCGDRGIMCFDSTGLTEIPGIQLGKKLDTVGAGDTVISALGLCLAVDISPAESATFANVAAAVTVQKLFTTGTASGEEIIKLSRNADYNLQPELAEDIRKANYLPKTEIEICYSNIASKTGKIKHALFDNDGTISTLREGWKSVMESVMIEAILGDKYEAADNTLYQEVQKQVVDYINMSTGIQTILQMEALVQMVDDFNIIPKDKILDKFGYKKIFNDALMKIVSKRLEKLETGQLNRNDFTIKGSVDFLNALKKKGIKLYLASGTDKDDVKNEAGRLGYADLFTGGIYGSENDIKKYSKKMIIDKIISENNLKGNELAVFGDGPVEIKECIRFNGIAIGVASDEIRRYGLNQKKRTRLIKAGAQIIIPDYSQLNDLTDLLFSVRL